MKIINMGEVNKRRKESIPQSIFNDKNYIFGIRSDLQINSAQKSNISSTEPNTPYLKNFG
jgi:hypothetical protein